MTPSTSKVRKIFWILVHGALYGGMLYAVYILVIKFRDPAYVDYEISVEGIKLSSSGGRWISQGKFPRFVLCAPDANRQVEEYEDTRIELLGSRGKTFASYNLTMHLTAFQMDRYKYFGSFGWCHRVKDLTEGVLIFWNKIKSLDVYMSFEPNEPFIPNRRFKISSLMKEISIRPTNPVQLNFHLSPRSRYTDQYPPGIKPYHSIYNTNHCRDVCLMNHMNKTEGCWKRYDALLRTYDARIDRYGCKWKDMLPDKQLPWLIYCRTGCKKSLKGRQTCADLCRPQNVDFDFQLQAEVSEQKENSTTSLLRFEDRMIRSLQISQVPKMRLDDLFSQVGGFLGLLIGYSLLSLVEVMEVIVLGSVGLVHKMRRKVRDLENENKE